MKVSVLMITYNHDKFIEQAIDSILMQQVNFDYEIVIGEDCSTDGTRDIIIGYQKKYPDKIRLLLPEQNLGMNVNFMQTFKACRGNYIALLEGDDFWTDLCKLQKQVDFLDSCTDCALCYGNMAILYEDETNASHDFFVSNPQSKFSKPFPKTITTIKDIIVGNYIPTASVMFRSSSIKTLPDWLATIPLYGDWVLFTLVAEYGSLYYINETFGVYRVHKGGIYSSISDSKKILKNNTNTIEVLNEYFRFKYKNTIESRYIYDCNQICQLFISEEKYKEADFYFKKIIKNISLYKMFTSVWLLSLYLKLYFPNIYTSLKLIKEALNRKFFDNYTT